MDLAPPPPSTWPTGPPRWRPSLHADDAAVQQALAGPLPEDPKAFHDLWQQLSTDDRDLLYSRDHTIGNHPGMPTGDNDMNPGGLLQPAAPGRRTGRRPRLAR